MAAAVADAAAVRVRHCATSNCPSSKTLMSASLLPVSRGKKLHVWQIARHQAVDYGICRI